VTQEKGRARPQIELALERWQYAELRCIGQIAIAPASDGAFVLCHRDDRGRDDLACHLSAQDAAELAKYDDAGNYRPLKTAPDLRHGWRLVLPHVASLRLALDLFYPGRLAAFLAAEQGQLASTPFRETLSRQSGMYRVAAKITDPQADALIARFCRSDGGCLRTILWKRDAEGTLPSTQLPPEKYETTHDQTGRDQPVIPLLCQEACNLLISETRKAVKAEAAP
jgi:sirohydrochlorin cobaltochelatase